MRKPHLVEASKFIGKCIVLNEERDFSFRLRNVRISVDNPLKIFVFESDFEGLAESEDGLYVLTISPYLKVVHCRENYDALHKHSYHGNITLGAFYDKDTVDASSDNFLALQASLDALGQYFPEYGAEFNKLTKKPVCIMYHDKCVGDLANSHPLEIVRSEDYCIGFIPCAPKFTSEVCDLLLLRNPNVDVICAYEINVVSNTAKLSFRSRKLNIGEKGYGVALWVAEGFNGSGHPSAAGAKLDTDTFTHLVRECIKSAKEK
ncbi:MAG: hypothetical protein ACRC6V_03380 [Bacteroidales bacterium]